MEELFHTGVYCNRHKLSQGLLQLGLQKGDRVAIISTTNRPEWHFTDLACMQIGVVDIPVYPTISSKEYEFIFNHESKICLCFRQTDVQKDFTNHSVIPVLKGVYSFDEVENVKHWKELLADNGELSKKVADIRKSIQPNDLATIIYTSGNVAES